MFTPQLMDPLRLDFVEGQTIAEAITAFQNLQGQVKYLQTIVSRNQVQILYIGNEKEHKEKRRNRQRGT